jgi:hypothetical protein
VALLFPLSDRAEAQGAPPYRITGIHVYGTLNANSVRGSRLIFGGPDRLEVDKKCANWYGPQSVRGQNRALNALDDYCKWKLEAPENLLVEVKIKRLTNIDPEGTIAFSVRKTSGYNKQEQTLRDINFWEDSITVPFIIYGASCEENSITVVVNLAGKETRRAVSFNNGWSSCDADNDASPQRVSAANFASSDHRPLRPDRKQPRRANRQWVIAPSQEVHEHTDTQRPFHRF